MSVVLLNGTSQAKYISSSRRVSTGAVIFPWNDLGMPHTKKKLRWFACPSTNIGRVIIYGRKIPGGTITTIYDSSTGGANVMDEFYGLNFPIASQSDYYREFAVEMHNTAGTCPVFNKPILIFETWNFK